MDSSERYLVQLTADDMQQAGTTADLFLKMDYVDGKGNELSTREISLRQASRDFFGYWPSNSATDDFAYNWGMGAGNQMYALVSLKNVDHFTGMTLRMDDNSEDEYQFKNLQIFSLAQLSARKVEWGDGDKTYGGSKSYVRITRDFSGKAAAIRILNVDNTVLVQQGDKVGVDFTSASVGNIIENSWDTTNYSLSYDDAMKNFGFTKARKTYNITGVYQQYNTTKEILPRSAADIVEVVTSPTLTVSACFISSSSSSMAAAVMCWRTNSSWGMCSTPGRRLPSRSARIRTTEM